MEHTPRRVVLCISAGLLVVLLAGRAGDASGQVPPHAGHLLGTVDFPISCSAPAQIEFTRAVALLHHMTYPQAREAFQRVAAIDPRCAMAHWGIAMTLFQPLWPTRPQPAALLRGWESVQKANSLQPPTERERLFVAAAEAFFLEPTASDYWLRIRRWEQAMEKVYAALPQDAEAAVFYALAHLAAAPATTMSRAHADRAAAILLRVHERNPDHPGDMHYLVHANDVTGRERESLEITRTYEAVAPRNPHALHMPTHIYTRLGDWTGVIRGNLRAAEAALEHPAGEHGEFVWDEFPHAIEYLVYAYLQKGEDAEAAAEVKRLRRTARLEPTFKTAFHLASTQARYALERRAWDEAAVIVPREPANLDWDRFAWPEAVARFAQGLGAAHLGRVNEARAAGARLEELEAATRKVGEDLFAANIRVLRLELTAWLAHVERQGASSVALMREAAELEASTPKHAVTPGPTLPAHELLGDLLMEQKQPAEALAAYTRALELHPKRFNGLLGAARAARAVGDDSLARTFYRELLDVAAGGTRQPARKEAEDYLARPAREGYIRGADGVRLFYRRVGTGATVAVMLHGGPGSNLNGVWPDLQPLADRRTIVMYDQRGGGRSEIITRLTATHHVRDLEALRVNLGLQRFALIGESWGSGLAVLYAAAHPEHVERLLLIGPMPPTRAILERRMDESDQAMGFRRQLDAVRRTMPDAPDPVATCREFFSLYLKQFFVAPEGMARRRGSSCDAPPEGVRNYFVVNDATFASLGSWDFRPLLARLTMPAMVIEGEKSLPSTVESARVMADSLPNATLVLVPEAGHYPHVERPELFFKTVERFLAGGTPAPGQ